MECKCQNVIYRNRQTKSDKIASVFGVEFLVDFYCIFTAIITTAMTTLQRYNHLQHEQKINIYNWHRFVWAFEFAGLWWEHKSKTSECQPFWIIDKC